MLEAPDVKLSLIIPALNEEEKLAICAGELPWSSLDQVIVVDNGSQDRNRRSRCCTRRPGGT